MALTVKFTETTDLNCKSNAEFIEYFNRFKMMADKNQQLYDEHHSALNGSHTCTKTIMEIIDNAVYLNNMVIKTLADLVYFLSRVKSELSLIKDKVSTVTFQEIGQFNSAVISATGTFVNYNTNISKYFEKCLDLSENKDGDPDMYQAALYIEKRLLYGQLAICTVYVKQVCDYMTSSLDRDPIIKNLSKLSEPDKHSTAKLYC